MCHGSPRERRENDSGRKNILISNVPKHPQFNEEINLQIKKAHEPHVE